MLAYFMLSLAALSVEFAIGFSMAGIVITAIGLYLLQLVKYAAGGAAAFQMNAPEWVISAKGLHLL